MNCQRRVSYQRRAETSHAKLLSLTGWFCKLIFLVQEAGEDSTVSSRGRAQEDKLDCYCVNCGSYIHAARLLTKLFYGVCKGKQYYYTLTRPVLIIAYLLC